MKLNFEHTWNGKTFGPGENVDVPEHLIPMLEDWEKLRAARAEREKKSQKNDSISSTKG